MPFCVDCGYYTDEEVKVCPKCGRGKRETAHSDTTSSFGSATQSQSQSQYQYQYDYQSRPEAEPKAEKQYNAKTRWAYDKNMGVFYEKTNEIFDKAALSAGAERLLAVCAYLGPLVFIPILFGGNSKFVRFHANQGLVNLIAATIASAGGGILGIFPLTGLVSAALSVLGACCSIFAIMGIFNALGNKCKELPLIGSIRLLK